jgi:hypothetical protein
VVEGCENLVSRVHVRQVPTASRCQITSITEHLAGYDIVLVRVGREGEGRDQQHRKRGDVAGTDAVRMCKREQHLALGERSTTISPKATAARTSARSLRRGRVGVGFDIPSTVAARAPGRSLYRTAGTTGANDLLGLMPGR